MGVLIRGRPSPDIYDEGALVATRPRIDFVGAGVTVTDDPSNDGVTVTIPTGGVTDHGALTGLADDDHTQYQKESEKGAASGYASLDAGTKVPTAQLGGAGADATKFLRGDQSWQVPAGGGGTSIADTDADTSVTTEAIADEDKVRITCAAVEIGLFQTISPHVTLTGDTRIDGQAIVTNDPGVAIGVYARFEVYHGAPVARRAAIIAEVGVSGAAVDGASIWGIGGQAASSGAGTLTTVAGLSFKAYDFPGGDAALTNLVGCKLNAVYWRAAAYATTLANGIGLWVPRPLAIGTSQRPTTLAAGADIEDQYSSGGSGTPTAVVGLRVQAMSGGATATGLQVADPTGGTAKITVEMGGVLQTTPSLRVAPWTPTANLTGVYMSEGATPTLRRVQWKAGNALVAGDKVMVLV